MWRCMYIDAEAPVARYYDISSKADCVDIFIVHNRKSSYRHIPTRGF